MSVERIVSMFKDQLVKFLDDIIGQFPEEGEFVIARIVVQDHMDIVELINSINEQLSADDGRIKKMITDMNESFFLAETSIFSSLEPELIAKYKNIWRSQLEKSDKESLWRWITVLTRIIERYVKALTEL
jgi:hypothetical protein